MEWASAGGVALWACFLSQCFFGWVAPIYDPHRGHENDAFWWWGEHGKSFDGLVSTGPAGAKHLCAGVGCGPARMQAAGVLNGRNGEGDRGDAQDISVAVYEAAWRHGVDEDIHWRQFDSL